MTARRLHSAEDVSRLALDSEGLVPVVVQDERSGTVLMVAWSDRAALERCLSTGEMHFWSRSRGEPWHKGATSGNVLRVRSLHHDCDRDTVLALVEPTGPACHTGEPTCFGEAARPELARLWQTLLSRREADAGSSYTARLLADENLRTKKLGEETVELVHALVRHDPTRVTEEAADLLYHVLVALLACDVSLDDVLEELAARRNRSEGSG